jgi:calcineurin-like phosphoesterase
MGYVLADVQGYTVLVANLAGCVYMDPLASPFDTLERILSREEGRYDIAVCDFHAEATSEKMALARKFDGRLSALWGTHTHVATADLQILPGGTGYITDLGMCGSHDGILGVKTEAILHKFLVKTPVQFEPAAGNIQLHGAVFTIDPTSRKCIKTEQIFLKL